MFVKNEKGITLIELLAVLVLVSLIGTLIMTTFTISFKYNVVETKKVKMQQEANYLVSLILQKHRTLDAYELIVTSDDKLVFKECNNVQIPTSCDGVESIIGSNYHYSLLDNPGTILPKEKDFSTTLIVKDPKNEELNVEVKTRFARYKSTTN
ncbi:prepilin-type N-terminal cleavage/methylation domain-containing protein [Sporosarcina sp. Marseille-Q4063]|uniref:prepilin-type N-terminal cleavage/methylation domain-containing protein n=1 Tax=Sporosarcina sp. Marseille-Q4063 TaxID=2810514 RepID=UPI001BB04E9D|nr:prepilin-type N-terminal cleavage/methylation domain-containing protein [Sporosarcina sp. Marseille-Q4063]QUW22513.1 prepilin-type N-terminal cleavage/methylation domain-containing protein [Sporosarcina sp. Marseille-Q4063]